MRFAASFFFPAFNRVARAQFSLIIDPADGPVALGTKGEEFLPGRSLVWRQGELNGRFLLKAGRGSIDGTLSSVHAENIFHGSRAN